MIKAPVMRKLLESQFCRHNLAAISIYVQTILKTARKMCHFQLVSLPKRTSIIYFSYLYSVFMKTKQMAKLYTNAQYIFRLTFVPTPVGTTRRYIQSSVVMHGKMTPSNGFWFQCEKGCSREFSFPSRCPRTSCSSSSGALSNSAVMWLYTQGGVGR